MIPMKLATAQKKDIKDMSLEELMAQALKNNPDIRLADSKVREAESELYYARAKVLGQLAKLSYELMSARELNKVAQDRLEMERRLGRAMSTEREMSDAIMTVVRTKQELAKVEGELAALVGVYGGLGGLELPRGTGNGTPSLFGPPVTSSAGKTSPAPPPVAFSLPKNIRQALDTKVRLRFKEAPGAAVVDALRKLLKGVNLVASANFGDREVSLDLSEEISLGAALQWLEDEFECRCVLRDYGIVIVNRAAVPPGAILLLRPEVPN
jgi:hypothetical protein